MLSLLDEALCLCEGRLKGCLTVLLRSGLAALVLLIGPPARTRLRSSTRRVVFWSELLMGVGMLWALDWRCGVWNAKFKA